VHGGAYRDLLNAESYGGDNPNAPLIEQLIAHGVTIELCGQTAAYRDVSEDDLLPGVTISLSAMTSHALLQQQGYTLNPF
jgi:intracellular sulfur oxidation DsrE/DsrF family protein